MCEERGDTRRGKIRGEGRPEWRGALSPTYLSRLDARADRDIVTVWHNMMYECTNKTQSQIYPQLLRDDEQCIRANAQEMII